MAAVEDFNPFEAYATTYAALAEATPGYRIAQVGRPGSLLCVVTPFPFVSFNRVMSVRLTDEEVEDAIETVMAAHEAAGVPGAWWLDQDATPVGLELALERGGYGAKSAAPAMARSLTDLPEIELPPGAELSFVHGRAAMREAQLVAAHGFGRPPAFSEELADVVAPLGDVTDSPVRVVVATVDGVAVSAATGVTAGDVCGVVNVATLPEARGKGLGRATTLAVLYDAKERGARWGVLHASRMGFGVYVRMGFHHAGDFRLFANG